MKDSKVTRILRSMSDADLKRLRSFLKSPFFRIGRDLTQFFDIVRSFHPSYDREDFSSEHIYKMLYPDSDFDENTAGNRIRVLSSELHSACKEYLIQTGLEDDGYRRKYYLLEKLRELRLYKEFKREYSTEYTAKDAIYKGGVLDMLGKLYLEHSFLEFNVDNQNAQGAFDSIVETGEYAAAAALILGFRNPDLRENCMRWNCNFRENLLDDLIKCLDSDKFIRLVTNRNDKFSLIMGVNYLIHKMSAESENTDAYFELKKLSGKYLSETGHHEKYYLLNIMLSFCTRNHERTRDERFLREEFEIVRMIVDNRVYKFRESDAFNPGRFRSFVLIASDNNEPEWLGRFIDDHTGELEDSEKINMKNYATGVLSFLRKDFEKALSCFAEVEPTQYLFKNDIRHNRMMIFYELDQIDTLYSLIDSSRHYAKSSKEFTSHRRITEINFLNFLTELLRIKSRSANTDAEELRIRIENELQVSSKKWLLEKVDELMK